MSKKRWDKVGKLLKKWQLFT